VCPFLESDVPAILFLSKFSGLSHFRALSLFLSPLTLELLAFISGFGGLLEGLSGMWSFLYRPEATVSGDSALPNCSPNKA